MGLWSCALFCPVHCLSWLPVCDPRRSGSSAELTDSVDFIFVTQRTWRADGKLSEQSAAPVGLSASLGWRTMNDTGGFVNPQLPQSQVCSYTLELMHLPVWMQEFSVDFLGEQGQIRLCSELWGLLWARSFSYWYFGIPQIQQSESPAWCAPSPWCLHLCLQEPRDFSMD